MIRIPLESYSWNGKVAEVRIYKHEEGEPMVTFSVEIPDNDVSRSDACWDMEPDQARALAAMLNFTADLVERPR